MLELLTHNSYRPYNMIFPLALEQGEIIIIGRFRI